MSNGAHKGSSFERLICRMLSKWWTGGERDDIFWRTSGSGAMATTRWHRGEKTANQYGDIHAVDPIGQPLLDACVIEMKNGYGKWSFLDQLDHGKNMKEEATIGSFIRQVEEEREQCGRPFGLLIAKRDQRVPVMIYPKSLNERLKEHFNGSDFIGCADGFCGGRMRDWKEIWLAVRLTSWLEWVHPDFFKERWWEKDMSEGGKTAVLDAKPGQTVIIRRRADPLGGFRLPNSTHIAEDRSRQRRTT